MRSALWSHHVHRRSGDGIARWTVRQQKATNRKNVHIFLTDEGRALKAKLVPLAEEVNGMASPVCLHTTSLLPAECSSPIITNLAGDISGAP